MEIPDDARLPIDDRIAIQHLYGEKNGNNMKDIDEGTVPKKSKFAECPAEFSVYSRDKYKNFLLTKFFIHITR